MATKSISQLDTASSVSASDLYEVAVPDVQSVSGYASKKESGAQIATFFHEGIQNNNLNTTNKTLVGAINELENGSVKWTEQNILGAKNLLPYPYEEKTKTENGVTFTDNGDGTVLVNGTATANTRYSLDNTISNEINVPIKGGMKYIFSRGFDTTIDDKVYIFIRAYYTSNLIDNESVLLELRTKEAELDLTSYQSIYGIRVQIVVENGGVADNILYKPMIRLASVLDDTWEPYTKTVQELTKNKNFWDINRVEGVKNYFPYPFSFHPKQGEIYNQRGVDFTDNGNRGIKAHGQNDNTGNSYCQVNTVASNPRTFLKLPSGKYFLTGGISDDYYISISYSTYADPSTRTTIGQDFGTGLYFEVSESDSSSKIYTIFAFVLKGKYADNVVFYPMIRRFEDNSSGYANFAMTNKDLTEFKAEKNLIAPTETSGVASQSYAIGDYMFWRDGFYKVTAAITQGGAITSGTNVTQTTIGAELKAALTS